jgi:hypothetical protein
MTTPQGSRDWSTQPADIGTQSLNGYVANARYSPDTSLGRFGEHASAPPSTGSVSAQSAGAARVQR